MRLLLLCVLSCIAIGCESKQGPKIVPFEEVPPALLQRARQELPEVKFDSAVRRSDGGLEIRGKDAQGKLRDVEFSAKGDLTEVE